jgi:hypothetical protein
MAMREESGRRARPDSCRVSNDCSSTPAGPTGWQEEPEAHLWPHLERAIGSSDSSWRLVSHSTDRDGRLIVDLESTREAGSRGRARLRADALTLVGQIAEDSTFVEVANPQNDAADQVARLSNDIFVDVLTGTFDDQNHFRSHGHTVQIRIRPA